MQPGQYPGSGGVQASLPRPPDWSIRAAKCWHRPNVQAWGAGNNSATFPQHTLPAFGTDAAIDGLWIVQRSATHVAMPPRPGSLAVCNTFRDDVDLHSLS